MVFLPKPLPWARHLVPCPALAGHGDAALSPWKEPLCLVVWLHLSVLFSPALCWGKWQLWGRAHLQKLLVSRYAAIWQMLMVQGTPDLQAGYQPRCCSPGSMGISTVSREKSLKWGGGAPTPGLKQWSPCCAPEALRTHGPLVSVSHVKPIPQASIYLDGNTKRVPTVIRLTKKLSIICIFIVCNNSIVCNLQPSLSLFLTSWVGRMQKKKKCASFSLHIISTEKSGIN